MSDDIEWGYAQHHLSARDVVDEERWQDELDWAIENALEYALGDARPGQVYAASAFLDRSFTDSFEKHLDANLHRPVELCSSVENENTTEQTKLVTDGGISIVEAPFWCPWCEETIEEESGYDHAYEHQDKAPYAVYVEEMLLEAQKEGSA